MKKVFFHIGYHRTGTTFIQSLLKANRQHLASHGCLYPLAGRAGDSHSPLALCLPSNRAWLVQQTQSKSATCEPTSEYAGKSAEWLYGLLQTELLSSEATRAVVSSECFLEFLDVNSLQRVLENLPFRPEFIVFLRRQDRWIESVFSQVVSDPHLAYGAEFECLPQLRMLDFAAELNKWIDCFGENAIHLKLYHEHGDIRTIVDDFSGCIDIDRSWSRAPQFSLPKQKANASLDGCCVEVLHLLNGWGQATPALRRLVSEKSQDFKARGLHVGWRLPSSAADAICDKYARRNHALFERLGVSPPDDWGQSSLQPNPKQISSNKLAEVLDYIRPVLPRKFEEELAREFED